MSEVDSNQKKQHLSHIYSLINSLERKDRYTSGHSQRVSLIVNMLSLALELNQTEKNLIVQAALLHDIGKLDVADETLNCSSSLSPEQIASFKNHPNRAAEILEPYGFYSDVIPLIFHHHECYDGSGYPEKIKGTDIPLGARMIAIADSFDAMISDRIYRRACNRTYAISELERCSGSQFDPSLVTCFLEKIIPTFKEYDVLEYLNSQTEILPSDYLE